MAAILSRPMAAILSRPQCDKAWNHTAVMMNEERGGLMKCIIMQFAGTIFCIIIIF